jgi:3-hydroxyacyl-CoA dehydrogenase
LERKKFVELCQERKTLERLESLVKNGKILRN